MSNLSNLYISASYKGIINLADSTQPFASQSSAELQDGLGNNIGISIDSQSHDVTLSSSLYVSNEISSSTIAGIGNVEQYSQSVDYRLDLLEADTGSQDARLDLLEIASQSLQNYTASLQTALTASGTDVIFSNDVTIPGTLRVYKIHTTIESSSVILSSGSNQLGDDPSDTQVFSGSVYVPNLHYLAGNPTDTDTRINLKLDSSWTSSVFAPYSSSVAAELANIVADALPSSWTGSVFLPFSTSIDARMTAQENFSSSLVFDFVTTGEFNTYTSSTEIIIDGKLNTSSYEVDSASFDTRITDLEDFSSSLDLNFVSEVEFAAFSSSNDTRITNLSSSIDTTINSLSSSTDTTINNLSSSIEITDTHQTNRIDNLASFTGSYATTGSNTFDGTQTINNTLLVSGSTTITGRVKGNIASYTLTSGSTTASLDCGVANFHTVTLTSGSNFITANNVQGGMTVTLQVKQPGGGVYGTVTFDTGSFKFPRLAGSPITTDVDGGYDIVSFVTFDNTYLNGVYQNDFDIIIP